jgi:hypothetical protein
LERELPKLDVALRWLYVPSNPLKVAGVIDKEYEKLYPMAEDGYSWLEINRDYPTRLDFFLRNGFNYSALVKFHIELTEQKIVRVHKLYLISAAERKGCRIIAALGKYKNENGDWPGSLDEIRPLVPDEVLVDPLSGGEFVYAKTEENFLLYSKGLNNIDENGEITSRSNQNEPDDWLIWPDRMEMRRKKKEAADDEIE